MESSYVKARKFLRKYPFTIAWRVRKHCEIIDRHLNVNEGEKILYIFVGQKNERAIDIFNTNVVAFTNKRIMVATKRVLFGYFFKSITPDMYNDLSIHRGLLFGDVVIDTIKEVLTITNIDPGALSEIETNITEIMLEQKKNFAKREKQKTEKAQ